MHKVIRFLCQTPLNESNAKLTQKTGKNKHKSVSFRHAHISMHVCVWMFAIQTNICKNNNNNKSSDRRQKLFLTWRPLRPCQQQLTVLVERQRERESARASANESNTSLKSLLRTGNFCLCRQNVQTFAKFPWNSPAWYFHLLKALCFDLILNLKCFDVDWLRQCAVRGSE